MMMLDEILQKLPPAVVSQIKQVSASILELQAQLDTTMKTFIEILEDLEDNDKKTSLSEEEMSLKLDDLKNKQDEINRLQEEITNLQQVITQLGLIVYDDVENLISPRKAVLEDLASVNEPTNTEDNDDYHSSETTAVINSNQRPQEHPTDGHSPVQVAMIPAPQQKLQPQSLQAEQPLMTQQVQPSHKEALIQQEDMVQKTEPALPATQQQQPTSENNTHVVATPSSSSSSSAASSLGPEKISHPPTTTTTNCSNLKTIVITVVCTLAVSYLYNNFIAKM